MLRWVATRLERSFRSTDLVARYGGEEFVVALLDTTDATVSERLQVLRAHIATSELCERRTDAPDGSGRSLTTSVSIGVARFPDDGEDIWRRPRTRGRAAVRGEGGGPQSHRRV